MPFAIAIGALLVGQTMAAVDYWRRRDASQVASRRLRVASLAVATGPVVMVAVAWDGLGISVQTCSSLSRPGDVRKSEEYVLGSCLIAASLSIVVAMLARGSRRVVSWLIGIALAATVIAALYFLDHAYRLSCLGD